MEAINNIFQVLPFCEQEDLSNCVSNYNEVTINMISPAKEKILQQKGAYLSKNLICLKNENPASISLLFGYEKTLQYFNNKP